MNIFDEDGKIYVNFQVRGHGKTYTLDSEYDDDVIWQEVLDDVVKTLESSWGYTFDLNVAHPDHGTVGVYYKGKDSADDDA